VIAYTLTYISNKVSHLLKSGWWVGIREIEEKIWLVSFMNYDLGFFDHETGRVECAENPFQAKVLPMPPE
jgi:putative transposase